MAKGYWIVRVDVADPVRYKEYIAANAAPLKQYGARFLVRAGRFENPEGGSRGGNAALCAALSARARGLAVLIVEAAPKHFRGGNSRHTRNVRTMHERPLDVLSGAYPEEEYWLDLVKVTGGLTDEKLARVTIRQ